MSAEPAKVAAIRRPPVRLPGTLRAQLSPHLARALDHQDRRELLMLLAVAGESQSAMELHAVMSTPAPSIDAVYFHLLVLEECAAIARGPEVVARHGSFAPTFVSVLEANPPVVAVLDQMSRG